MISFAPHTSAFCFSLLVALSAAVAGCGDDDDSGANPAGAAGSSAGGAGGGSGGTAGTGGGGGASGASGMGGGGASGSGGGGAALPKLSELPAGTFTFVKTGGETKCAKGSEYGFYVRPGASEKVVIDFSGGGACWDDVTCGLGETQPVYASTVQGAPAPAGIYDHANAENPVAGWTHVFIPYCTGDVHWGNNVKAYNGGAVTLNHVGAVNARAVLDWVYGQFAAPERVFVTGCSAGAYGSLLWSAHVREHYKAAPTAVAQLGDAGVGVAPDDFFPKLADTWKPQSAYPSFVGDFSGYTKLSEMYVAVADHYPTSLFSELTTRLDTTQATFYSLMGGPSDPNAWSQAMLASLAAIDADTDNFASYVASGDVHCTIPRPEFYTIAENGERLVDWVGKVVGGTLPANVACPDCVPASGDRR
jgi:pectinacetylesterase